MDSYSKPYMKIIFSLLEKREYTWKIFFFKNYSLGLTGLSEAGQVVYSLCCQTAGI